MNDERPSLTPPSHSHNTEFRDRSASPRSVDRGTRKPSVRTMKAHRQDFEAIATSSPGGDARERVCGCR